MRAIKRHFLVLIFLLFGYTSAEAQIRVECLSRTDSFAFLGTGSDNRVRIHNLPPGAEVNITPGAAVPVRGDEYVLCRFGSCMEKGHGAVLTIAVDGRTVFEKEYTLLPTDVSGSEFNPLLHLRIGKHTGSTYGKPDTMSMTAAEFYEAVNTGDIAIAGDTAIKMYEMDVSSQRKGCDYVGPYHIGRPYFVCGTLRDANAVPKQTEEERLKEQFKTELLRTASAVPGRVFIECAKAIGKGSGVYIVMHTVISVR